MNLPILGLCTHKFLQESIHNFQLIRVDEYVDGVLQLSDGQIMSSTSSVIT
jgi:hypothetical protein